MAELNTELLAELRNERQEAKLQISALEETVKRLNKQIRALLEGAKVEEFVDDGLVTRLIQKHRTTYDWGKIKLKIGMVNWKSIIREVPDEDLLTDAIAKGKIKSSAIKDYVSEEPLGEPHVEVRRAKADDDE